MLSVFASLFSPGGILADPPPTFSDGPDVTAAPQPTQEDDRE